MTINLSSGTLDTTDDLSGWTITSKTATIEGLEEEPEMELREGDRIMCDGRILRNGAVFARV